MVMVRGRSEVCLKEESPDFSFVRPQKYSKTAGACFDLADAMRDDIALYGHVTEKNKASFFVAIEEAFSNKTI